MIDFFNLTILTPFRVLLTHQLVSINFEIILRNCSFLTLFLSMIFYWIQTAFSSSLSVRYSNKENTIQNNPNFFKRLLPRSQFSSFMQIESEAEKKKKQFSNYLDKIGHSISWLIKKSASSNAELLFSQIECEAKKKKALKKVSIGVSNKKTSVETPLFFSFKKGEIINTGAAFGLVQLSPKKTVSFNLFKQPSFNFKKDRVNQVFLKKVNFGTITMILSNFLLMFLLIFRGIESGHFPLSNLYESLMFLSWSCTIIHLFLEFKTDKFRLDSRLLSLLIGSITSPIAFFTNAFATFNLPAEMQKASPLVPALQSNWLMMHVTVMIISYSALILGSLLSIAFLVLSSFNSEGNSAGNSVKQNPYKLSIEQNFLQIIKPYQPTVSLELGAFSLDFQKRANAPIGQNNPGHSILNVKKDEWAFLKDDSAKAPITLANNDSVLKPNFKNTKMTLAWNFDNLSYRVLGIGFPFLTIGILSGAVWANEAWGSYWSWDPKETWALLTWLIFAIYLHARITKGWQGKKPAIIASFGFVAIWICFLGVNLIGEGLHSYGWFSH